MRPREMAYFLNLFLFAFHSFAHGDALGRATRGLRGSDDVIKRGLDGQEPNTGYYKSNSYSESVPNGSVFVLKNQVQWSGQGKSAQRNVDENRKFISAYDTSRKYAEEQIYVGYKTHEKGSFQDFAQGSGERQGQFGDFDGESGQGYDLDTNGNTYDSGGVYEGADSTNSGSGMNGCGQESSKSEIYGNNLSSFGGYETGQGPTGRISIFNDDGTALEYRSGYKYGQTQREQYRGQSTGQQNDGKYDGRLIGGSVKAFQQGVLKKKTVGEYFKTGYGKGDQVHGVTGYDQIQNFSQGGNIGGSGTDKQGHDLDTSNYREVNYAYDQGQTRGREYNLSDSSSPKDEPSSHLFGKTFVPKCGPIKSGYKPTIPEYVQDPLFKTRTPGYIYTFEQLVPRFAPNTPTQAPNDYQISPTPGYDAPNPWYKPRPPTNAPSKILTEFPSNMPSHKLTMKSTNDLSKGPSEGHTESPSNVSAKETTAKPTDAASNAQSEEIIDSPDRNQTIHPTKMPTIVPSNAPSKITAAFSNKIPSNNPTNQPNRSSEEPTKSASNVPRKKMTMKPTDALSNSPSNALSNAPSKLMNESLSNKPTSHPTKTPTNRPTSVPSNMPAKFPSNIPTNMSTPTPTDQMPNEPSEIPTESPSNTPTLDITMKHTDAPSYAPSIRASKSPSKHPTNHPTKMPINKPPIEMPTEFPSKIPTDKPTIAPMNLPSNIPSEMATVSPSNIPTKEATTKPTKMPSNAPSYMVSELFSYAPTEEPTMKPNTDPLNTLTNLPSYVPPKIPSDEPSVAFPKMVTDSPNKMSPTRGRMIGGFVWDDINGNGIQDADEVGIEGVTVYLCEDFPDGSGSCQVSLTNDGGSYEFDILGSFAPNFFVGFRLPLGYVFTPKDVGFKDERESAADEILGRTASFPFLGVDDLSWDAGLVRLTNVPSSMPTVAAPTNAGVVGGLVWKDKNANGTKDNDELGRESVTVFFCEDFPDGSGGCQITATDSNGRYHFSILSSTSPRFYVAFRLPSGCVFSPKNVGSNNEIDSDADEVSGRSMSFSFLGVDDLSWGAGLVRLTIAPSSMPTVVGPTKVGVIGGFVFEDTNASGTKDDDEPGREGVTVFLCEDFSTKVGGCQLAVTGANGLYQFDILGSKAPYFFVGFRLPLGYVFSPKNVGPDDEKDSDADEVLGRTISFPFEGIDDLSWAAGLVRAPSDMPIIETNA